MRFRDRRHAGEILGDAIAELEPTDPIVYALPRGGVPVGFEVARVVGCPLDILVVRKIGVPYQPELAMGAIAEGGVVVRNEGVIKAAGIGESEFQAVMRAERTELDRRVSDYRKDAPSISPAGKTAIVVDDGLATGSTAQAAVAVLEELGAQEIWLAVPVAPRDPIGSLEKEADRVIVLSRPRNFGAVGYWYSDFGQTSDHEVRTLLSRSRLA